MSISATDLQGVRWRTSSYTNGGNDPQCVECGCLPHGDHVAVRDTKNRGPELLFTPAAFAGFLAGLKRG